MTRERLTQDSSDRKYPSHEADSRNNSDKDLRLGGQHIPVPTWRFLHETQSNRVDDYRREHKYGRNINRQAGSWHSFSGVVQFVLL